MARIGWIFTDTVASTIEVMEINPNEGASPAYAKNLTKKSTTADNRTLVFEGQDSPRMFEFSGDILTQNQYNFLLGAFEKRHPVQITDDLGREFVVYFESFSPTRVRSASYPWRHKYTATTVIINA